MEDVTLILASSRISPYFWRAKGQTLTEEEINFIFKNEFAE